jgi:hypothetical protein
MTRNHDWRAALALSVLNLFKNCVRASACMLAVLGIRACVRWCVCVCVRVRVCVRAHTHAHTQVYVCTCVRACMRACVRVSQCVCV